MDVLSDVGGIQGILLSFAAIIVSILTTNSLDNSLVQRLYTIPPTPERKSKVDLIRPERACPSLKDFLMSLVPQFCIDRMFKPSSREQALEQARQQLLSETSVIELVQQQRLFCMAIKHLLPKPLFNQMQAKSRLRPISDPDKDISDTVADLELQDNADFSER